MRYWVKGQDEDFQRQADHARRFGDVSPSNRAETLGLAFVFGVEGLLILSVVVALIVSLR